MRNIRPWSLPVLAIGCATTASVPNLPAFTGEETSRWLVQESEIGGRDDLLPAFEASAQSYGCVTDHIGSDASFNIQGERRTYFGVSATCEEGSIALITLVGGRARIGCSK